AGSRGARCPRGARSKKDAAAHHAGGIDPRRPGARFAQGRRAHHAPREAARPTRVPSRVDRQRRGSRGPDGRVARPFSRREQMIAGCTGALRRKILYLTLDTRASSVNVFTPAVALELERELKVGL